LTLKEKRRKRKEKSL